MNLKTEENRLRRNPISWRLGVLAALPLFFLSSSVLAQPDNDDLLPPDQPAVEEPSGDSNPHAHAGSGAMPGIFVPPEDTESPEPTLPEGTIAVDLKDGSGAPIANEILTLGILINSIAKGDSRKHVQATTDAAGHAVFSGLDTASNIAYRVSAGYQGGAFAATPFQLAQAKAMHVVLHVYPVVHNLEQAVVVAEATLATEIREDRLQIEEVLTFYNWGHTAWQPSDVHLKLPAGFTAFSAQTTMSDQSADATEDGAKLRGTFAPGRHTLEFRWQLPWLGDKDVDFDVGMPPHVAIARVMMPATSDVKLSAVGFPPADIRRDSQGQSFLVTERQLRPDDAKLASISMGIHGLPTAGPGRLIATFLAVLCLILGLVMSFVRRPENASIVTAGRASRRAELLRELAELQRARDAGDVGPHTYERAYRELIDGIARTLQRA